MELLYFLKGGAMAERQNPEISIVSCYDGSSEAVDIFTGLIAMRRNEGKKIISGKRVEGGGRKEYNGDETEDPCPKPEPASRLCG